MAPEVREGRSRGVSADIWSLGVMALELIVGEQAMSGPLLSKNLPDHLEIRITRLLDTVDNNNADVKNFVRACLRKYVSRCPTPCP
jgi:serine/threonine protein kinase